MKRKHYERDQQGDKDVKIQACTPKTWKKSEDVTPLQKGARGVK